MVTLQYSWVGGLLLQEGFLLILSSHEESEQSQWGYIVRDINKVVWGAKLLPMSLILVVQPENLI